MKILLVVTGAMSAARLPELGYKLLRERHELKIVMTEDAYQFVNPREGRSYFDVPSEGYVAPYHVDRSVKMVTFEEWQQVEIYREEDSRFKKNQQQLHLQLRNWAEVLLVAPLNANMLAKFALGLSDDLPSKIFRSWIFDSFRPVLLAPTMDHFTWDNPWTKTHLDAIKAMRSPYGKKHLHLFDPQLGLGVDDDNTMAKIERIVIMVNLLNQKSTLLSASK